jgi:putative flippase GtrA
MRLLEKLGIHTKQDFFRFAWQFIKFGMVGVSNTLISLGVYYLALALGAHYLVAHTAGFVISVVNAYYWNNRYVFQKQGREHKKAFVRVFLVYGATFLLGLGLLSLMIDVWGVSDRVAPLINLLVTIPLNFLLNKFWAMK